MKQLLFDFMRIITLPSAKTLTLDKWGYWLGRFHDIKLYGRVRPNGKTPTIGSSSNINIIIDFIKKTTVVPGHIAECGVFRGATIASIGYYVKQNGISKKVLGFDSYEGFDREQVKFDKKVGDEKWIDDDIGVFADNSLALVEKKLKLARVSDRVQLVKGYFNQTLKNFANEKFSFVHIDCDLYEPYKECLEFFYPRLSPGGIILFDEYNDPVYKGCNKAVDEFLSDKPEKPIEIIRDNYIKYYILKK